MDKKTIRYTLQMWWHRAPLIVINVGVWLAIIIASLSLKLIGVGSAPVDMVVLLPPSVDGVLSRPWTVLTYMFSHFDVMHILVNMLWLYLFSSIFLTLCTRRQLNALYLLGGFGGAVFYIAACALFPGIRGAGLIGASASVMAIVIASAILTPDMGIPLFFFGEVKVKWIAVAAIVIFALGLGGANAGGQAAHFGGVAVGALFGAMMRRGRDITRGLCSALDWLTNLVTKPHVGRVPRVKKYKQTKSAKNKAPRPSSNPAADIDQEQLDRILDKIKKSGYAALSADEKRQLFEASSTLNRKK